MKKVFIFFSMLVAYTATSGQELFVFSEPASNMATKSVGFRLNNNFERQDINGKYNYYLNPEIMWGASKKLMLHAEGYFNNSSSTFKATGGGVYGKYRFYSDDDVHTHFRLAAYGRLTYNNSVFTQRAIDFDGYNSGYEAGVVATKLLN
ncbi:MAG: hypothetical protein ABIP30_13360, partial [Ferruginibacter sp.]